MSQPPYDPNQPNPYGQPYQPYPYTPPTPQPSNGLGIAGFVVSLVGIVTGGILSPIGLLLSLIALFRPPRGFAIAGLIIGLIGSLVLLVWLFFFGMMGFACFHIGKIAANTAAPMARAEEIINRYSFAHHRDLPEDPEGNTLITGINDGWGHPLHYHKVAPNSYELRSAGPDGIYDNGDDVVNTETAPPPTTTTAPTTGPIGDP